MIVELGPYRSDAASAWIAHARQLLDFASTSRAELPIEVPPEVIEGFRWYLDEWDNAADKRDDLRWSAEIEPTDLRTLLTYWLNLARVTDERQLPISAQLASQFYPAIVADLLDALEKEPGYGRFCDRARMAWPGLGADGDT